MYPSNLKRTPALAAVSPRPWRWLGRFWTGSWSLFVCFGCSGGCDAHDPAPEATPDTVTTPSKPSGAPPTEPLAFAPKGSAVSRSEFDPEPGVTLRGGGKRVVSARYGAVTSVEAQATKVGVAILEAGGNAVDAAVATAYALAVTHPNAGNIGGGGFMLVRQGKTVTAIDFRETAPARLPRDAFDTMIAGGGSGPVAVGVPGTVAGLELARQHFGRLSRGRVMAPAIRLAKSGYSLGRRQHLTLGWSWSILGRDPAFRKRFAAPNAKEPAAAGTKLTRPRLAETLGAIARDGTKAFYQGRVARAIVDALGPKGLMTLDDLRKYEAKLREPLVFPYRGLKVITMPPPSGGGVAVAQTLLMLDEEHAYREPANSVQAIHLFVEAARRAHAERRFSVVDPDALSPAERNERLRRWLDPLSLLDEHPISRTTASRSDAIHPLPSDPPESENTTHFSVVDAEGMAVSCTVTLSASFGAKVMADDVGVILNNAVASFSISGDNLPIGGRRTVSSMAPTFVFERERLRLILGSPGGDTIPNTVVQVLRNVVDYGMTLDDAVDAPRVHHGFVPDEVRLERTSAISAETRNGLLELGHRFSLKQTSMGDANDILIDGATAFAYADPREGGLARAAEPHAKSVRD